MDDKVIPQEQQVDYSYEDLKKDIKDIASEEPKEEIKETPKEEVKPEVKEEEVEEVDAKEFAENIAKETAKETAREIAELQAKKEEEDKPIKSAAEEYLEKAKEEGKTPTWEEAMAFLEESAANKAIAAIKAEQETTAKVEQERVETQRQQEQTAVDNYNKIVDEDLNDLYSANKLTPIKDKENPSDQGVVERKALFQAMLEVNQDRLNKGLRPVTSIKEIYYEHYTKPSAQPAGKDAPVSLGDKGINADEDNQEIDYVRDVRKPWSLFRK